jgi:hypothetical protein
MTDQSEQEPNRFPAARGLAWLAGSWMLLRKEPLRLFLLSLFLQILLSFSQARMLGLLVVLCLPALSAGMLQAFNVVECGKKPLLAVLFSAFTSRARAGRLLLLGGLVILVGLVVVSVLLSGSVLQMDAATVSRIEGGDLQAIGKLDPKLIQHTIIAMAAGAAVTGSITYFAAPLIWFGNRTTGRAVLSGLKALGRNWKPLLVLAVAIGILALPLALLFSASYVLVLSGGGNTSWPVVLMVLLGPLFQLLLFGTQYMSYRDIFGLPVTQEDSAKRPDSQFVA